MRVEEYLDNAWVHPQGDQIPPQDNEVPPQDQAPTIPQPMMDGEIRSAFVTFSQAMTTQAQAVSIQAQAMVTETNRNVGPRVQQSASIMTSPIEGLH